MGQCASRTNIRIYLGPKFKQILNILKAKEEEKNEYIPLKNAIFG